MPICGMGNIIRRVKDMTITFKKGLNPRSVIAKHAILLQASSLITGREGVLETEKELYLMLAMIDFVAEEDIVAACNEDERGLVTIMAEDIEPRFFELIQDEEWNSMYLDMRRIHLDRCQEIWNHQHSVIGVIDALLTVIGGIDDEGKQKLVEKSIEAAKYVEEKRTEKMAEKTEAVNSKLEELVKAYQRKEGQLQEKSNV